MFNESNTLQQITEALQNLPSTTTEGVLNEINKVLHPLKEIFILEDYQFLVADQRGPNGETTISVSIKPSGSQDSVIWDLVVESAD
jgi:hypothetical protein